MTDSLTFTLKSGLRQRVDVSPLTPDRLQGLSRSEICELPLHFGSQELPVSELFKVSGSNYESIRFENSCGLLDCVGSAMSHGLIQVEGDAASYLGLGMRGGRIVVQGSVDAYAAAEMKGGALVIEGHAGDFLAAARPGNKKGMSGGLVRVQGDVGDRAGDHMRSGIVLIEGNTGEYLASRMTAGTIIVLGHVGAGIGFAMNRGTLLLKQRPKSILPTFVDCGLHSLGIAEIIGRELELQFSMLQGFAKSFYRVRRFAGDRAALGYGEILVAEMQ